ncbi:hypothetical protein C8J57DRAFT_1430611 [Mycena rebaudengoi]|nr:hypothetical protein C8J57DRAFT_1430611 [Mycena rebaudengoi]
MAPDVDPNLVKPKTIKRKDPPIGRVPGKSLLPFSKVQHIIKADKDIAIVAKEATYLICCATEEFIKRFSEAAMAIAERESVARCTTVVRKADEFLFLEEIIPWEQQDVPIKRRVKPSNIPTGGPTMLDQFVVSKAAEAEGAEPQIVVNEDGTMHVAGDSQMADDFE